jgi:hypothetical protein
MFMESEERDAKLNALLAELDGLSRSVESQQAATRPAAAGNPATANPARGTHCRAANRRTNC